MIFSNILLSIICVQLASPVHGDKPTLEIETTNIGLGEALEVAFRFKEDSTIKPSISDFVGIYGREVEGGSDYEAYLYTCGADKSTYKQCEYLDPPQSGALTFSAEDLGVGYHADEYWPLNPGKYKACLVAYDTESYEYTLLSECKNFKVNGISNANLKQVDIMRKNRRVSVGDSITIRFNSGLATTVGQWIALYPSDEFENEGGITDSYHWIYTGCDNQIGNQRSELCSKIVNEGKVVIDQSSQEYWALPAGEYKVCLIFNTNENADNKYDLFKCSRKKLTIME